MVSGIQQAFFCREEPPREKPASPKASSVCSEDIIGSNPRENGPGYKLQKCILIELAGQVDPEGERGPGERKEQGKWGHSGRANHRDYRVLSMSYVKAASIQRSPG